MKYLLFFSFDLKKSLVNIVSSSTDGEMSGYRVFLDSENNIVFIYVSKKEEGKEVLPVVSSSSAIAIGRCSKCGDEIYRKNQEKECYTCLNFKVETLTIDQAIFRAGMTIVELKLLGAKAVVDRLNSPL